MSDKNNRLCGYTYCAYNTPINGVANYGDCKKFKTILNCQHQKRKLNYVTLAINPLYKVIPKYSNNTYYFQGPINFYHLCEEARQSETFAFLAISNEKLYFGFSRQLPDTLVQKYKKDFYATRIHDTYLPFHIFTCKKNYTTLLMDRLKNVKTEVKKTRRKVAKQLYKDKTKGEFSNKPSTKVMVFK